MSPRITRRQLLGSGIKAGVGLAVWNDLKLGPLPAFAFKPAWATTGDDSRFQPAFARLDEFIAAHMRDIGAPGMTLALANRDGLLRASAYGFADTKVGAKVQANTLFEVGSISKSFVALALMQMREEGKFDTTKPITSYLPWLKVDSKYAPITGHHLLSHTSGLPDGVPLELFGLDQPLWTGFAPGERFAYSNVGYDLLGLVLEAIDRQPMATVLRRRVLDPLGMASSEPVITNAIRLRMAIGYAPMFDDRPFPLRGELAEAPWVEFGEGAGSVSSTATDMGKYLAVLLNRGKVVPGSNGTPGSARDGAREGLGRIVSEETFKLFVTPAIKAPFWGEDASYGYGLWVNEVEGRTLLRHTGGMVAFSSAMHVDLSSGFGSFASVNANLAGYRPNIVAKYALDLLRAAMEGKDLPSAPATSTLPDQVPNAADFAGTFISADGSKLMLAAEGGKLWLAIGSQRVALERAGGDRFVVKHPDFDLFMLEFARERNMIAEAFHGPRWFTNERYTGPKTFDYPKEWEAFAGHYRNDSPWFGSTRIFARKGKLTADGTPLTPLGDGLFRLGPEEWSPERLSFGPVVDGRATRMKVSGVEFHRTFTP
jgi:CubicO group peptidase (beta-lactamase class C family)